MTDDGFFEALDAAVYDADFDGSLVHTGGGVMVYHLNGRDGVSVGIDETSVVLYVDEEEVPDIEPYRITDDDTIGHILLVARDMLTVAEERE